MDRELEEKFNEISQKIEDQFRFTRNVIVLCTLTIIGVLIFAFTTTMDSLPDRMVLHYMSNLDKIVAEWKACENVQQHRRKSITGVSE
ncbi:hypothetical protein GC174_14225 [bacterium]|nr:hypothetical protein [bacterium]